MRTLHTLTPDALAGALIGLARATEGNEFMLTASTSAVTAQGLAALAQEALAPETISLHLERIDGEKRRLVPDCYNCAASCGRTSDYCMDDLASLPGEIQELKRRVLDTAAKAAAMLPETGPQGFEEHSSLFYRALYAVGMDAWGPEELNPILADLEELLSK